MTAMPTEDEIAQLPRWAQVAFAARCAERVLPLYSEAWPDVPISLLTAVHRAVRAAEEMAASASITPLRRHSGFTDADAGITAIRSNAEAAVHSADGAAWFAARAALDALDAARFAVKAQVDSAASTAAAMNNSATASDCAYDALDLNIRRSIDVDYGRLLEASRALEWTVTTPVGPEFFGPLWPDEPPNWAAVLRNNADRASAPLSLYFDASDFSDVEIAQILGVLSSIYTSIGGDELVIDGMTILDPCLEVA